MKNKDEKGDFKVVGWKTDEMAMTPKQKLLAMKTGVCGREMILSA